MGRTVPYVSTKLTQDGLHVSFYVFLLNYLIYIQSNEITRVWESTQTMCAQFQPVYPEHRNRHQAQRRDDGDQHLMQYTDEDGYVEQERRGSYHFVQGWKQQGHANDVSILFFLFVFINKNCSPCKSPRR